MTEANRIVILVGLPGAGKSTVGRVAAERLGVRFVDLDDEIERQEGRSVADIFARDGEPGFRRLEAIVTGELARGGHLLLAPGGGWLSNEEAVATIQPTGRIIYLRVSPSTAIARMGASIDRRPLLKGSEPLLVLERLFTEREPKYSRADAVVDTEVMNLQQVAEQVTQVAAAFFNQ